MKIYVDIEKQAIIKIDDEQREIYKGDSFVDKMKVYCTSRGDNWYLTLSAKLANGRPTNDIMQDESTTPIIEDGVTWYLMEFTLSREKFTLCEGMATFYLKQNFTGLQGKKIAEKYLGSWQDFIHETTELDTNVFIGDPSEAVNNLKLQLEQLRGLISALDASDLLKQNKDTLDLGDVLDGFISIEEAYGYLYDLYRGSATRSLFKQGEGKTNITAFLGLDPYIEKLPEGDKWAIHFIFLNSDETFRILLLFRDNNGLINLAMGLDSNANAEIRKTGWIDLNYLSILKERDIEHDNGIKQNQKDIKDLQGSLLYNNVGLMWVSDFDIETGNITYILNPNFEFTIDDSRLQEDGKIDWYVRPKSSLVNKEVE